MKKKLAVITSHPIQYNAPLFRLLTQRGNIDLKIFYTWGQTEQGFVYDPDFKQAFKWDIPLLEGYEKEFVENISQHPTAGRFSGIDNKDLIERIDRYAPDALLVFGWSFKSHLRVLRHYGRKKTILFRGDSNLLDEAEGFSVKKLLRSVFLSWVYRHIDLALYTGAANKAYYLKYGLKEHQLLYAAHAVENERFYDEDGRYEQAAAQWRKDLGIGTDEKVFLFAGKLEPKKDPLLLLEAFQQLDQENIRLIFVGKGVLEEALQKKAGDDPRILFLGFQNQQQMPVVYRLATVFVLPSKGPGETWGLSVNEALASDRPVLVSTKCGCATDLVEQGVNGFIFEAGDAASLLQQMKKVLETAFVTAHIRTVVDRFRIQSIAEAIETTL
ncbi:glycosyltransferase involved in cell wall biosynthesis [Lacibacter cauensis]|uniref:Glycosyltransferase involved in cell wall biosynthesis n=1 Tax=Lacibacter cauensis TaxID=510947 RepID=A0A562SJK1_9BACT|nr:glycosyltransferase family 4 protein [Lacibacter cauensis]TWI81392.1 glycosyltransferase involved in cell wall biosynthesis [Lacibacter cauensis]